MPPEYPIGDILIDLSEDEVFPNSHDDPKRSIQTSSYWEVQLLITE